MQLTSMQLTRENKVEIIGTIESIDVVKDTTPKSGAIIRGNLVIKVSSPKVMSIPLNFYVAAVTKDNKPRKLYSQIDGLRQGQRVNIVGQIQDNKFWDATRGQLVKSKRLGINFLNPVSSADADKAEFTYSGFVKEGLREVHDKEGNLTSNSIKMAQVVFSNDRAQVVDFMVDMNDTRAVRYIQTEYTGGKTVKVTGQLDYDVRTETREEQQDFGKPIVKTFQRNISNLVISGGVSVTEGVYESTDQNSLLNADLDNDREVEEKAKNTEKSGAAVSTNKPITASTSTSQSLL